MFSVGTREIALSTRNAVHNGPAEHNQTLNIEAGLGLVVMRRPERGCSALGGATPGEGWVGGRRLGRTA